MVEFGTILSFIQATGIIVGVAYYIMNLKNQEKNRELALKSQEHSTDTREAQLFLSAMNVFTSPENVKIQDEIMFNWVFEDFDDFMAKYGPDNNIEAFALFDSTNSQLESMGVLVKHGLIDPVILSDMIGGHVIGMYEKFQPVIVGFRQKFDWPQAWDQWEYLYKKIKPLRDNQTLTI